MKIKQLVLLLLGMVISTFIIYSCSKESSNEAPIEYSGEEIFRAIFFLEGDAANRLASLKPTISQIEKTKSVSMDKKGEEFVKEMNNELIKTIKELDKNFFNNFKQQIESDDYYSIQLAIGNGARMLRASGFKSKYASLFNFLEEVENKNINMEDEKFKALNFEKESDVEKFLQILAKDYGINMDKETQLFAVCNAGIACALALVAVATMAIGAQSVVGVWVYYVYSKVEFWGVVDGSNIDAVTEGFIRDVALTF